MGRLKGIEPSSVGTTIRCVNHFTTIAMIYKFVLIGYKNGATEGNRTLECRNHNPMC